MIANLSTLNRVFTVMHAVAIRSGTVMIKSSGSEGYYRHFAPGLAAT